MAMSKEERNAKARARYAIKAAAKKELQSQMYGPVNLSIKQRNIQYPDIFTKTGRMRKPLRVKVPKMSNEERNAKARAARAAKKASFFGPVNLSYKERAIQYPDIFTKTGRMRKPLRVKGTKSATKRAPSAYNMFVSQKMKELKNSGVFRDGFTAKDAMKYIAQDWNKKKK